MFFLIHTTSVILVVSVFTLLGLFVFLKNQRSRTNQSFALFSLIVNFWIVTNFFADTPYFYSNAILWNKMAFAAGMAMGSVGIPLILSNFPAPNKLNIFWRINIPISIVIIFLMIFTPFIIKTTQIFDWGTNIVGGPLYSLPFIWGTFSVASLLLHLFLKFKQSTHYDRARLEFFLLGLASFLIVSVALGLILPAITGLFNLAKFSL